MLETCDALVLRLTGVRPWHLHPVVYYKFLNLLLLILGISQTWFQGAAHSGDSNLKVFRSTELTSHCDIFLQADRFCKFYDNIGVSSLPYTCGCCFLLALNRLFWELEVSLSTHHIWFKLKAWLQFWPLKGRRHRRRRHNNHHHQENFPQQQVYTVRVWKPCTCKYVMIYIS